MEQKMDLLKKMAVLLRYYGRWWLRHVVRRGCCSCLFLTIISYDILCVLAVATVRLLLLLLLLLRRTNIMFLD